MLFIQAVVIFAVCAVYEERFSEASEIRSRLFSRGSVNSFFGSRTPEFSRLRKRANYRVYSVNSQNFSTLLNPSNRASPFKRKRSISNAVVETASCDHENLVECAEYDSDEKMCWVTYGGMRCCICTGRLKILRRRKWLLW
ncbi:hypothetical protein L596_005208 [Steinernema carpocapsae]|uniref:Uncharacterized protein n=1 Tax=Steinernema carpocapsae TaxID=34508 RepID=A0A4U8UY76_STECR|nr:hypothetical protein L596_005208 [Steinernema carpocapsae]